MMDEPSNNNEPCGPSPSLEHETIAEADQALPQDTPNLAQSERGNEENPLRPQGQQYQDPQGWFATPLQGNVAPQPLNFGWQQPQPGFNPPNWQPQCGSPYGPGQMMHPNPLMYSPGDPRQSAIPQGGEWQPNEEWVPNPQLQAKVGGQSAEPLLNINRRLFGVPGSMMDTPVSTVVSVIMVASTDPEFHRYYKRPYTADQALAAIEKSDPACVEDFLRGMKKTGLDVIPHMEAFVDRLCSGFQVSTELSVGVIVLALVKGDRHPRAAQVQDTTQAWLNATDMQVVPLLKDLAKGVVPQALLTDKSLSASPGLARLKAQTFGGLTNREAMTAAFVAYYEAVFTTLTLCE